MIEKGIRDLNENSSNTYMNTSKNLKFNNSNINKLFSATLSKNPEKIAKNVFLNPVPNYSSKQINLDKSKSENSNLNELLKYFQDNDMNFLNFCEFFKNFYNSENSNQYLFVLVTANKSTMINREPISNYEISVVKIIF